MIGVISLTREQEKTTSAECPSCYNITLYEQTTDFQLTDPDTGLTLSGRAEVWRCVECDGLSLVLLRKENNDE